MENDDPLEQKKYFMFEILIFFCHQSSTSISSPSYYSFVSANSTLGNRLESTTRIFCSPSKSIWKLFLVISMENRSWNGIQSGQVGSESGSTLPINIQNGSSSSKPSRLFVSSMITPQIYLSLVCSLLLLNNDIVDGKCFCRLGNEKQASKHKHDRNQQHSACFMTAKKF